MVNADQRITHADALDGITRELWMPRRGFSSRLGAIPSRRSRFFSFVLLLLHGFVPKRPAAGLKLISERDT